MRLNATSRLYEFSEKYPPASVWVSAWLAEVKHARWTSFLDIQKQYPTATVLGNGHVVFDMKGFDFKLDAYVSYTYGLVIVQWVKTRAEFSSIKEHKVIDETCGH